MMSAMPFTPSRRGLVPPFIAMDVLREALAREAAGHSVIHLEVGQPGTPAPQAVLDAAREALGGDRPAIPRTATSSRRSASSRC